MRLRVLVIAAFMLLFQATCALAVDEDTALFVCEYENGAWGYQRSQTMIDADGNIYERHTETENADNRSKMTDYVFVRKVDKKRLDEMVALVGPASFGKITEEQQRCMDFGTRTIYCYDTSNEKRERILLYQWGDTAAMNTADEARRLTGLLLKEMLDIDDMTKVPCRYIENGTAAGGDAK